MLAVVYIYILNTSPLSLSLLGSPFDPPLSSSSSRSEKTAEINALIRERREASACESLYLLGPFFFRKAAVSACGGPLQVVLLSPPLQKETT